MDVGARHDRLDLVDRIRVAGLREVRQKFLDETEDHLLDLGLVIEKLGDQQLDQTSEDVLEKCHCLPLLN